MDIDMDHIDVNCAKCGRTWTASIANIKTLRVVVCERCEAGAQTEESKEGRAEESQTGSNYPFG
jgi:hypothetical protein